MDNSKSSMIKELRERFSQSEDQKSLNIAPLVNEILGIVGDDLEEVIVGDIRAMIKKNYRQSLEGYVFCLSRILNHDKCWKYINIAFKEQNEKVPNKYYNQFGQNLPS